MKARKRIDRPTQWEPDTRPLLKYVIARRWNQVGEVYAPDIVAAKRKAMLMFPRFPVDVFWPSDWENMLCEQESAKRANLAAKKKKAGKLIDEPKPLTEAERTEGRNKYQQLKADYLAGLPIKCSDKLKAQFEAFRPRKHVPIAVVADLETSHKSKPINQHKWRPLQSGLDMDRVCSLIEHADDNDHETA